MYAPMSVTQEARPELRALVARAHPELPVQNHNAPHLMQELGSLDLRREVAAIACPVLVLYGLRDAVMVAGGEMLRTLLPGSESIVLDDVGHEPFIEAAPETFAALHSFLCQG
jgi:pimeloyl-ACP methyl ester carboxylesterase